MTPPAEQTRARYPDEMGDLDRDGVRIHWERYGDGDRSILFLPTWSIVHSRCWKAQIPYLARRYRVIVFDPRGNGLSGRPLDAAAYAEHRVRRRRAGGARRDGDRERRRRGPVARRSAGRDPRVRASRARGRRRDDRSDAGPCALACGQGGAFERFHEKRASKGSWHQYNAHYWRRDFPAFLEFFFGEVFTEPHSTKQIEDCVGWGLEGGVDCLLAAEDAPALGDAAAETAAAVRCPMLVIHGDCDAITPHAVGAELARLTGGTLATIEGGGHCPQARDPVAVNLLIRDFVESLDDWMTT